LRLKDLRKNDTNESFFDSFDRQKKKFSKKSKLTGQGTKVLSKEAQLYDLLRMKNEMIIKQNLDRIMIGHINNNCKSGDTMSGEINNGKEMSLGEFFFKNDELIVEVDEPSSSEDEVIRADMDDRPVYNLKKTRFML